MKKQDLSFPVIMLILSILLANEAARAEGTVELMCKTKAKEIALQTYQNCVTDEKTTRLKDIKERYKARMSEVKDQFQKELSDLNGGAAKNEKSQKMDGKLKAQTKIRLNRPGRAEKPLLGVAKSLPAKQNDNGPALSLQATTDGQAVVTPETAEIPDSAAMEMTPEPEMSEVSQ